MSSEIRRATAAYRSAHNINILSRSVIEQKVIEGKRIFFDGVGDERSPAGLIVTVGWILYRVESDIEFSDYGFDEISHQADIFGIAVEIEKTFFGLPALFRRYLHVGNFFAVLVRWECTSRNFRMMILTSF